MSQPRPTGAGSTDRVTRIVLMLVLIGFPSCFLCSCYQAAVSGRPRTPCKSNMKRIALAFHDYHDRYSSFPPAFLADTNGRPMHSWRVLLLPFLGCQDLYDPIPIRRAMERSAQPRIGGADRQDIPLSKRFGAVDRHQLCRRNWSQDGFSGT